MESPSFNEILCTVLVDSWLGHFRLLILNNVCSRATQVKKLFSSWIKCIINYMTRLIIFCIISKIIGQLYLDVHRYYVVASGGGNSSEDARKDDTRWVSCQRETPAKLKVLRILIVFNFLITINVYFYH